MRKARRGAGVVSILLAGSSGPVSVAEKVERGLRSTVADAQNSAIPTEEPSARRLKEGNRFALITWGGSSGPCSADLAPTTHELPVPESVTRRPVTLALGYPDGAATKALVLH